MADNNRLFPHRPETLAVRRVERRRRMRGENEPRRPAKFEWCDENRHDESWDECAAVTVTVRGKLGSE